MKLEAVILHISMNSFVITPILLWVTDHPSSLSIFSRIMGFTGGCLPYISCAWGNTSCKASSSNSPLSQNQSETQQTPSSAAQPHTVPQLQGARERDRLTNLAVVEPWERAVLRLPSQLIPSSASAFHKCDLSLKEQTAFLWQCHRV